MREGKTANQTNIQTDGQIDRKTERWTDRQAARQADTDIGRLSNRQTDDSETETDRQ